MNEELTKAIKDGFTAKEVEIAQSAILQESRIARSQDTSLVNSLIDQSYLGRTYQFGEDLETKIKSVTPEMARTALQKYINPAKLVIIRAGTFK